MNKLEKALRAYLREERTFSEVQNHMKWLGYSSAAFYEMWSALRLDNGIEMTESGKYRKVLWRKVNGRWVRGERS